MADNFISGFDNCSDRSERYLAFDIERQPILLDTSICGLTKTHTTLSTRHGRQTRMNRAIIFGFLSCFVTSVSFGQSTISDRPFELSYGSGPWGVLLPSYNLGTDAGGSSAFQDDGDTLGARWQLKAVRRFLGTRTSFETKVFYGWAEANSIAADTAIGIPSPIDGSITNLTAAGTHLQSGLNHYGIDVALRDTWRTRFGGLSAGAAFSYMAFDQEYQLDRSGSRFITENLDTDYVGGKGFVGWDGCFLGRRSKLDLAAGYYDLNVDYQFAGSAALPVTMTDNLSDFASTAEAEFTTYFYLKGFDTGLTFGVMYLSDMPVIARGGTGVSLATEDAILISARLEIVL